MNDIVKWFSLLFLFVALARVSTQCTSDEKTPYFNTFLDFKKSNLPPSSSYVATTGYDVFMRPRAVVIAPLVGNCIHIVTYQDINQADDPTLSKLTEQMASVNELFKNAVWSPNEGGKFFSPLSTKDVDFTTAKSYWLSDTKYFTKVAKSCTEVSIQENILAPQEYLDLKKADGTPVYTKNKDQKEYLEMSARIYTQRICPRSYNSQDGYEIFSKSFRITRKYFLKVQADIDAAQFHVIPDKTAIDDTTKKMYVDFKVVSEGTHYLKDCAPSSESTIQVTLDKWDVDRPNYLAKISSIAVSGTYAGTVVIQCKHQNCSTSGCLDLPDAKLQLKIDIDEGGNIDITTKFNMVPTQVQGFNKNPFATVVGAYTNYFPWGSMLFSTVEPVAGYRPKINSLVMTNVVAMVPETSYVCIINEKVQENRFTTGASFKYVNHEDMQKLYGRPAGTLGVYFSTDDVDKMYTKRWKVSVEIVYEPLLPKLREFVVRSSFDFAAEPSEERTIRNFVLNAGDAPVPTPSSQPTPPTPDSAASGLKSGFLLAGVLCLLAALLF